MLGMQRRKAQQQISGDRRQHGAAQGPQLGFLNEQRIAERQPSDEQAHGETNPANHGDGIDLQPCRAARPGGKAGLHRQPDRRKDTELLRSEEHTSELQSLMRISYAVFCLKKKKNTKKKQENNDSIT